MHVTRQPCCDFSARGAARCGAARRRGVHYFQHRFCAFRPLTHSTVNPHTYISTRADSSSPCRSPSNPSLSRRTYPQTSIFRIFELLSPSLSPFFVLFLSGFAMTESISFRYNFLDVTRLFTRTDQFSAKNRASRIRERRAIRVKSRGRYA